MSANLWVRCKHPTEKGKFVTVKVDLDPAGAYAVKGAKVFFEDTVRVGNKVLEEIDADNFSEKLAEHGFDENEIRFEIEDVIENMGAGEVL